MVSVYLDVVVPVIFIIVGCGVYVAYKKNSSDNRNAKSSSGKEGKKAAHRMQEMDIMDSEDPLASGGAAGDSNEL